MPLKNIINIGIVIINYNGTEDTIECLKSINLLIPNQRYCLKIFLVDNNSKLPISKSNVEKIIPNLVHIQNKNNEGFAEGNNIGIRYALNCNCDYIALINNDTIIVDDSLFRLIDKMEENEDNIGIGGIVNYYFSDSDKIWHAGIINDFNYGKPFSVKNFNRNQPLLYHVDYVPGSSMVIKREVFDKIGLLDAKYFAYFEENDFCIRAKIAGFQIAFLQNTKILHKIGQASSSNVKVYLRTRNTLLFYSTYATSIALLIILIRYVFKTLISIISSPDKSISLIRAMLIGIYDFYNKKFYEGSINDSINDL